MNLIVGFAGAFNVDYLKASSLHHATQLKVGFAQLRA
jgi:hypothetical protein